MQELDEKQSVFKAAAPGLLLEISERFSKWKNLSIVERL